jgi:hypothetical protein
LRGTDHYKKGDDYPPWKDQRTAKSYYDQKERQA